MSSAVSFNDVLWLLTARVLRKCLAKGAISSGRSRETEKPLEGFLTKEAIKGIYLFGAKDPELISPDNWESDFGFMERPNAVRVNLNLFYDYR